MSQPDASPAPHDPPTVPAVWAPPSAAPFGTPTSGAGAPAQPPGAPQSWSAPPAGVYAPPLGYAPAAGYPVASAGPGAVYGPPAPAKRSGGLGFTALALALVATVGASLVAAIASFNIGLGAGREVVSRPFTGDFDWGVLTPVRDWVLLGEVSFWVGTALGVWALIQGIVAIVTSRGRGAGIAAVVIAALGPIAFGAVVQGFLTAGLAAGTGIGG
ncbi:hypothetical protein JNB63_13025 [Microbacterium trichothecenolyticum]|uniref:hypothetical protein n=1 Tax=Microbacterium trichothecenolyticum TaxID=69370 RepID=UPI001C6F0945|nr:hypothetical protein [Microbacterium trichothecenolyticum]MBW9121015.1 hypothetical protein [Microbacterium trichothecenolyticum]